MKIKRSDIEAVVKEVLQEMEAKVKKGDYFNHEGETWVVVTPGTTESRVAVAMGMGTWREKGIQDNKIIVKNRTTSMK